jgi:hypothetical protein
VLCVEVSPDKVVRGYYEVCNVVDNIRGIWLLIGVEDSVSVDVNPEEVPVVH